MPAPAHSTAPSARDTSPTYRLANRLLGGRRVLRRLIHDEAEAHQRILQGLPTRALLRLLADLHVVPTASLLHVIGIRPVLVLERPDVPRAESCAAEQRARADGMDGTGAWSIELAKRDP